jgi:hypothetical protein
MASSKPGFHFIERKRSPIPFTPDEKTDLSGLEIFCDHSAVAFRSFAFRVRALAAAFEALVAIARRCSAVIVFSLALPPRRPNSDRYFDNKDFAISTL